MTILRTVTGSCTFSGITSGSCHVSAFYRRHAGDKDSPLFEAARRSQSGLVQIGHGDFINASVHNSNNGKWVVANYNAVERSFIKLLVKKKVNAWGYRTRGLMLMPRENANLLRIRIPLLDRPDASMPEGSFEGRFDIIYPSAWEHFGLSMPDRFAEPFEAQETADTDPDAADDEDEKWFDYQILQKGDPLVMRKTQAIETAYGNTVEVVSAAKPRLIRLRKPRK